MAHFAHCDHCRVEERKRPFGSRVTTLRLGRCSTETRGELHDIPCPTCTANGTGPGASQPEQLGLCEYPKDKTGAAPRAMCEEPMSSECQAHRRRCQFHCERHHYRCSL